MSTQAHRRAQEYRWETILDKLFKSYEMVVQEVKQRRVNRKAA
jgi:hypothetical protein